MAAETIKEFLVSLGWQSRDAQYLKFSAMIEGATLKEKLLGGGFEDVAESFEQLYYQSMRTGQSAEGIRALAYAVGSTAEGAVGSLEAMGKQLPPSARN
jgi:hypothetical protein